MADSRRGLASYEKTGRVRTGTCRAVRNNPDGSYHYQGQTNLARRNECPLRINGGARGLEGSASEAIPFPAMVVERGMSCGRSFPGAQCVRSRLPAKARSARPIDFVPLLSHNRARPQAHWQSRKWLKKWPHAAGTKWLTKPAMRATVNRSHYVKHLIA